jgi:hypothetical protein
MDRLQQDPSIQLYVPNHSKSSSSSSSSLASQASQQQQQHCDQDWVPQCSALLHTNAATPAGLSSRDQLWQHNHHYHHHQQQQQRSPLLPAGVRTISWPGGGVLFFWQLGVMSHLYKVWRLAGRSCRGGEHGGEGGGWTLWGAEHGGGGGGAGHCFGGGGGAGHIGE